MDPTKIEIEECGIKTEKHSGFMDITDYPSIGKIKVPTPSPLPDVCKFNEAEVSDLIEQIRMEFWEYNVATLSGLPTRIYNSENGRKGSEIIYEWLKELCGNKCKPTFFNHTFLQPSVILVLEGTSEERVILGAHLDSISNVQNAPGADDDASGVGVLIETARVLLKNDFKPKKTVEFQFYAAEEIGLVGSQAIVAEYAKNEVNVYAMIQFDMVGYSRNNIPIFINDFVNPELNRCLREFTVQLKHPTWGSSNCGYACSDHASYNKAGYRSSFPHEAGSGNSNPYIHTINDVLSNLNSKLARYFVELAIAGVHTLASI